MYMFYLADKSLSKSNLHKFYVFIYYVYMIWKRTSGR